MKNKNDHIIDKFQVEEKKSKKRMVIYSSIPFIITIILVVVSYLSIVNAQKEVKDLQHQKDELEKNVVQLNTNIGEKTDSLSAMKKVMELAVNYNEKRYEFNYAIDKYLYSKYPRQTEMLSEMREMIEAGQVKWKLGGNSPEKGFDSPSFATFIINQHSNTQIPNNDRYKLKEILPTVETPKVGDIIFYEHGYAMFYFEYRNQPFVVGMTPLGLSSLTYDFGVNRIGYGKVNY